MVSGRSLSAAMGHTAHVYGVVVSPDGRIVPISSEADLYYHDWVEGNLARVTKATDGQIGYLHVPDMQTTGLNQFAKSGSSSSRSQKAA